MYVLYPEVVRFVLWTIAKGPLYRNSYAFLISWSFAADAVYLLFIRYMSGCSPVASHGPLVINRYDLTSTGRGMHKFRTKRIPHAWLAQKNRPVTQSSVRWRTFQVLCMLKTSHRSGQMSTDLNAFATRQPNMKRIPTDINWLAIFLSVGRTLGPKRCSVTVA